MALAIPDHILWNNVPGDLVLLDAIDGGYHAMTGIAADIWRAVAGGQAPNDIVAALAAQYDAPAATVVDDVTAFLADAQARGLLVDA